MLVFLQFYGTGLTIFKIKCVISFDLVLVRIIFTDNREIHKRFYGILE